MTAATRWKMTTLPFLTRSSARFWPFSAVSTRDCILIRRRNRESFTGWFKASLCICLSRRYCHPLWLRVLSNTFFLLFSGLPLLVPCDKRDGYSAARLPVYESL